VTPGFVPGFRFCASSAQMRVAATWRRVWRCRYAGIARTPTRLATFAAILVRERGLIGAAQFLRDLAATLDALDRLRDHSDARSGRDPW